MLFKFSFPFVFLIIGYSVNSHYLFDFLIKNIWVYLAYFSIYIIVINILDIGLEIYINGIKTGFYTLNGLYVPVFSLIFVLFFFESIRSRRLKILTFIFSILTLVITLSILKRTLILILFFGLILFLFRNFNFKNFLRIGIIMIVSAFLFQIYFYEYFGNTLESRENRFGSEYSISQEGRFTENQIVFQLMKESLAKLVFGFGETFNDMKYISFTIYDEREIHNSYARIFWNGGFYGLILFLIFYWIQLKTMVSSYLIIRKNEKFIKQLFYFGFVLVIIRIINDLSSGITYLSYNALCYLIIGYLFRIGSIYFKYYRNRNRSKVFLNPNEKNTV